MSNELIERLRNAAIFATSECAWLMTEAADALEAKAAPVGTPSSTWAAAGEPDPHGNRYNCERAALAMGDLTDDELANGAFMNYDRPLNIEGILAGTHSSPIAWMTAVKDRIRWLSRKLAEATGPQPSAGVVTDAAARDLLAERQRQISAEGWTPEHDDEHAGGEMADAAGCYAHAAAGWNTYAARDRWPWSLDWWKPSTPRRDLVKAGALILAEIERLDRQNGKEVGRG